MQGRGKIQKKRVYPTSKGREPKGSTSKIGTSKDLTIVDGVEHHLKDHCECYTTPYNKSPFPGAFPVTMSTTTNRDTLQYESTGVRHDMT